jgi:predicted metal-dependent hydrolase
MTYTVKIDGVAIEIKIMPVKEVTLASIYPGNRFRITSPIEPPVEFIKKLLSDDIEKIKHNREIFKKRREYYLQRLAKKPWPKIVYVFGKPHKLNFIEFNGKQRIEIEGENLNMYIRPNSSVEGKWKLLDKYYKNILEETAHVLIKKWEPIINVTVNGLNIKKVNSYFGQALRWKIFDGSKYVNLAINLARHSHDCIECVVVHELVHLIQSVPGHNKEFYNLMDHYLPDWRTLDKKLNDEAKEFSSKEIMP